jgi:hypothetical protein
MLFLFIFARKGTFGYFFMFNLSSPLFLPSFLLTKIIFGPKKILNQKVKFKSLKRHVMSWSLDFYNERTSFASVTAKPVAP